MPKKISEQNVAIIYDHLLTEYGGAEFVLQTLHTAFPSAPIFTTIYDPQKSKWAKGISIIPSFLQKYRSLFQIREILDVFTPIALEQADLTSFDIIISVTSSAAKGVLTSPQQLHICYLLTPTRYLYQDRRSLGEEHLFLSLPIVKQLKDAVLDYLRWWDQVAASRPDKIIAISNVVAQRTSLYYHRTTDEIIYPPIQMTIDQNKKNQTSKSKNKTFPEFFLCFSRLVSYKRIDIAISACVKSGRRLVIGGTGREEKKLQSLYSQYTHIRSDTESLEQAFQNAQQTQKNIIFFGSCTKAEKEVLFTTCTAVIMPGIEDFGITAVEANGYGKPVILSKKSGAAEIIIDSIHGFHLHELTINKLIEALENVEKSNFNRAVLRKNAERFSQENFVRKLHNIVYQFLNEHSTIIK